MIILNAFNVEEPDFLIISNSALKREKSCSKNKFITMNRQTLALVLFCAFSLQPGFSAILSGKLQSPILPRAPQFSLRNLPRGYNVHQPPPLTESAPTPIQFSIVLFGIFDINELQGDISLETNLKIFWKDSRLANLTGFDNSSKTYDYVVLNPSLINEIWTPDAFIDHMKSSSHPFLISKAASLRLYPDGSLRYSARILINLNCVMDFHYYPADTQRCSVDIKSYAYSNQSVLLSWKQGPELAYPIDLHHFDVALETQPDYLVTTRSASYSGISFSLYLRRKLSYHIIQTYIPSALFTIVSWLSFLLPPESTPGRMALTVTTLLTLTAMFSSVRSNVNNPSVSYVKALDLWMVACILFVFSTLVEYTTVMKLRSLNEAGKKKKVQVHKTILKLGINALKSLPEEEIEQKNVCNNNNNFRRDSVFGGSGGAAATPLISAVPGTTNCSRKLSIAARQINIQELRRASKIELEEEFKKIPSGYLRVATALERVIPRLLPASFVIFNFIYWPVLLIKSDYYNLRHGDVMYYSLY